MPRYRKKPVVIEAFRLGHDNPEPWWAEALKNGLAHTVVVRNMFGEREVAWEIETLEGPHRAHEGDWIIRGVAGELYPCKHDIFRRTYEPAVAAAR